MGFFAGLFKRKKKPSTELDATNGGKTSNSTSSKTSSKRTEKSRSSKKKSERAPTEPPNPEADQLKLVQALMDHLNKCSTTAEVETYMTFFDSKTTKLNFEDFSSITAEMMANSFLDQYKCFPDMSFKWGKIYHWGTNEVRVDDIVCAGTHTGAPFTFLPGVFPPVPVTGKYCVNDEESLVLKINPETGKIRSMQVVGSGALSGPAGFYEQIGGSMVPPGPPPSEDTSGGAVIANSPQ